MSPRGPSATNTIAGVELAHVDITATHRVELWEVRPGSVMMLQKLNGPEGDEALDLGPMLLESGGTYGGLYRKLLNDPNAPLSPELVAADEHRRNLPIRDASLPLPKSSPPPRAPRTSGPAVVDAAPIAAEPGALSPQSTRTRFDNYYDNRGITNFNCSVTAPGSQIDYSWCPQGGYYNYIYGHSEEVIFYDSVGYNPQGRPANGGSQNDDLYTVWEWTPAAGWVQNINWTLWPGETLRTTFVGTPAYYEGEVTGKIVSFANSGRLSFPQLTQLPTHPAWVQSAFGNDINGLSHRSGGWLFSRTENGASGELYGCIDGYSFPYDLQSHQPGDRCKNGTPSIWSNCGFNHYGDIVYDSTNDIIWLSMNMAGSKNGAIAALKGDVRTPIGFGIVDPNDSLGWVALNPKNRAFYTSSSQGKGIRAIHQFNVNVGAKVERACSNNTLPALDSRGLTITPRFPATGSLPDIALINDPANYVPGDAPAHVYNIQGGKVSVHGKLWVNVQYSNTRHVVLGIDPYSGIVQVANFYDIPTDMFTSVEAEGLDMTDDNPSTNTGGVIHAQILGNNFWQNDQWSLINFAVNDMSRL